MTQSYKLPMFPPLLAVCNLSKHHQLYSSNNNALLSLGFLTTAVSSGMVGQNSFPRHVFHVSIAILIAEKRILSLMNRVGYESH
jgi:hypothetical protein